MEVSIVWKLTWVLGSSTAVSGRRVAWLSGTASPAVSAMAKRHSSDDRRAPLKRCRAAAPAEAADDGPPDEQWATYTARCPLGEICGKKGAALGSFEMVAKGAKILLQIMCLIQYVPD